MSIKKDCSCSYWSQGQQECLYHGNTYCVREQKPTVNREQVEKLGHMMDEAIGKYVFHVPTQEVKQMLEALGIRVEMS